MSIVTHQIHQKIKNYNDVHRKEQNGPTGSSIWRHHHIWITEKNRNYIIVNKSIWRPLSGKGYAAIVLGLNALFITNLKVAKSLPKALCYVFVRQNIDPLSCCLSRYTWYCRLLGRRSFWVSAQGIFIELER